MVESESKRREEGSLINRVRNTDMSTWKYMLLTAAFAAPPLHAQEAASAAVAPAEAPAYDRIAAAQSLIEVMMPAAQRAEMMGQIVEVKMANDPDGLRTHFGAAEDRKGAGWG